MKKSAMIVMLTGLLWACNSDPSSGNEPAAQSDGHAHAHEATLTLNNGQKWKADMPTNENVTALRTAAQNFAAGSHSSLSDYASVASELQNGLDKMIRECKMSGADHDALHVWLEPLLKGVGELTKAKDAAAAEKIFNAIDERLDLYPQYFE